MKINIIIFALLVFLGCQSPIQRIAKESPNSTFLYIANSELDMTEWKTIFDFLSDSKCEMSSIEPGKLYKCSDSAIPFYKSLVESEILEQEEEKLFVWDPAKKTETTIPDSKSLKRIQIFAEPIEDYNQGNFSKSLAFFKSEQFVLLPESKILKERIQGKIENQKNKILTLLDEMIVSIEDSEKKEHKFQELFNEYYVADPTVAEKINSFKKVYTVTEATNCQISVVEPSSRPYVSFGFEEDVKAQFNCDKTLQQFIQLTIQGNDYLKVGSEYNNESKHFLNHGSQFEFSVNALSMNASQNVITFSIDPIYKDTLDFLNKSNESNSFQLQLTNASYQFLSIPESFSPIYDEYAERYSSNSASSLASIKNGRIQSEILSNGKFSLGGANGSENFDLTFGHPNGMFADGIWSSYTSIKVDDTVINLNDFNHEIIEKSDSKIETLTSIPDYGIEVISIWESPVNNANSILLSYKINNTSNTTKDVGLRIFMDTWAGYSDGVPFALPANPDYKNRIITEEISFNANASAIWETTDYNSSGQVFLQNILVGDALVPPDEIQFVNWGSAFSNDWDYLVSETRSVTGDSAVSLKWNQSKLSSNQTKNISTLFSSIERKDKVSFQLVSPNTGNGMFVINKQFLGCETVSFDYSVRGGSVQNAQGTSRSEIHLAESDSLDIIQIPLTIFATGKVNLEVKETCSNKSISHSIPIELPLDNTVSQPNIFTATKKIPVQFSSRTTGKKLEARLIDPITEKIIQSTELKEEKKGDSFVYSGFLDGSTNGNYIIEYIDLEMKPPQIPAKKIIPIGMVQLFDKTGVSHEGKLISQDENSVSLETKDGKKEFSKSQIRSIKFGRSKK